MKNSGQNPRDLPSTLQGVLELREWYWETSSEIVLNSGTGLIPAATVAGNFIFFTVPLGEVWALLDYDFIPVTGAGQSITFRLMFMDSPAPNGTVFGLLDYVTKGANNTQGVSTRRNDRIVVMRGGYQIGLHISAITTAAADIGGSAGVRIARCKA